MKRISSLFMFTAIAVTFLGQVYASTAFTLPNPGSFRNNTWSFGEIFTVGAQSLSVTALGAYDQGGDGFVTAGGIPVGIFRESDHALLVSTLVTSGNTLSANFRYATISPLTLLSGVSYRVVAVNESDNYNLDSSFSVDPAITRSGFGYCQTSVLTSCDVFTGNSPVWMANFQFSPAGQAQVPEPLSVALTGTGLAALGIIRARRKVS
jgi:hypothetical protein